MKGMFSTSLDKEIASGYAASKVIDEDGQIIKGITPVVFIIQWGNKRTGHFLVEK